MTLPVIFTVVALIAILAYLVAKARQISKEDNTYEFNESHLHLDLSDEATDLSDFVVPEKETPVIVKEEEKEPRKTKTAKKTTTAAPKKKATTKAAKKQKVEKK